MNKQILQAERATGPRAYFFEQGRAAAAKYATLDEAAKADEPRMMAYATLDGHKVTNWEAQVLATAYQLGWEAGKIQGPTTRTLTDTFNAKL